MNDKEQVKISKYPPLSKELSCYYQQPVNIIVVVFGYSGIVSVRLCEKLPCFCSVLFADLQKAALLETNDSGIKIILMHMCRYKTAYPCMQWKRY